MSKDYEKIYKGFEGSKKAIAAYERAFAARLEYEKNCISKYDYPKRTGKPSKTPVRGERIEDFAFKFNTTVKEMKDFALQEAVDKALISAGWEID